MGHIWRLASPTIISTTTAYKEANKMYIIALMDAQKSPINKFIFHRDKYKNITIFTAGSRALNRRNDEIMRNYK